MALKSRREYKYLSLKTQNSSTIFLKYIVNMQMITGKKFGTLEEINRFENIAFKTRFIPFIS